MAVTGCECTILPGILGVIRQKIKCSRDPLHITVHTNTTLQINLQPITAKHSTKGQDSERGTGELLKLPEIPGYNA